jgi:hypothetical protein
MPSFRLTVFRDAPTPEQSSWCAWLMGRGIKAAIEREPEGYAVYREGIEAVDTEDESWSEQGLGDA